jgi:hypothetical protein
MQVSMVRSVTRLIAGALLLGVATRASGAQVVRGDVADSATGAPLFAAMIVAYDTAGARAGGAITNDSGHFALRLPAAGRFSIRAERIGYASSAPVTFDVSAGATITEHLIVTTVAVTLSSVVITGSGHCNVRPAEGVETALLYEEARKALYATQIVADGQLIYAVRMRYKRTLDGTSLIVRKDLTVIDSVTLAHPWQTPATPEELAKGGYEIVYKGEPAPGFIMPGDSTLAAPDADVLLSDAFARTHCFHARRDPDAHPGLIGLAFDPALKRSVPDVTGTLWLDSLSAELRYVEFRHTNLFPEVSPRKYGGRMDFERLPGGFWIVKRWTIRMPVLTSSSMNAAGVGDARFLAGGRRVAVFHDDGGEVLSAKVVSAPPR